MSQPVKRSGRLFAIAIGLIALLFIGVNISFVVLTKRGRDAGIRCANRIFALAKDGKLVEARDSGLLSQGAYSALEAVGDKSGRFDTYIVKVDAVQALGTPCLITVDATQGRKEYKIELELSGDHCLFANEAPAER